MIADVYKRQAFAGCMYLIFAPSGKEDVNVESVGGFNADIPLPAEDGIIADKQKAYEQAVTSRKPQDKIQSLAAVPCIKAVKNFPNRLLFLQSNLLYLFC